MGEGAAATSACHSSQDATDQTFSFSTSQPENDPFVQRKPPLLVKIRSICPSHPLLLPFSVFCRLFLF